MDTLAELLARERRSDRVACRLGAEARVYDYDRFLTTAWQAGNYLRHLGVREGVAVGIADDPIPEALFGALGTGLLGATAWFGPPSDADLRAILGPADEIEAHGGDRGRQRVAYGGTVADPSIERFEEGLWSENPTMPPERPDPGVTILTDGTRTYAQRELLDAASGLMEREGLTEATTVVVRASLGDPGTFVGVLGTLYSSATVVFPESEERAGDVALGEGPERRAVEPARLLPGSGQ